MFSMQVVDFIGEPAGTVFSFGLIPTCSMRTRAPGWKSKGREQARTRVLGDDELRLFWPRIVQSPVTLRTGQGLRLALLLGLRIGEVAGAARREFSHLDDPERAWWLIPERTTENGRAHFVPLPLLARSIVQAVLELVPPDQPYLFPGRSNSDLARPGHGFREREILTRVPMSDQGRRVSRGFGARSSGRTSGR
jgi:integrase